MRQQTSASAESIAARNADEPSKAGVGEIEGGALLVGRIGALALLYGLLGYAGLSLAQHHQNVTLFWPPTGLSLAALIVYGRRLWPGVFLGALSLNLVTDAGVLAALGIAVGNTLEALVGVTLLERLVHFRPTFERIRDVIAFAFFGGVACTLVSATVGVASLSMMGSAPIDDPAVVWLVWWLGDLGGAIVVTPLLLLARSGSPDWHTVATHHESLPLFAGLILSASTAFSGLLVGEWASIAAFMPFPFVAWAGTRLGSRGAMLASTAVTLIAIAGSSVGRGPFAVDEAHTGTMLLWCYAMVMATTALTFAAAIAQRDRAQQRYQEGEDRRLEIERHLSQKQRLESLGLLAGGIAHDFNNILASILGNSLLLQSKLEEDRGSHVRAEKIEKAAKRAAELCNQLLVYAGRGVPSASRLVFQDVIDDTCAMLRSSLPQHVTLETAERCEAPIVDGDAAQLRQVVMNLVLNSADAIDAEGGAIRLALSEADLDADAIAGLTASAGASPGRFAVFEVVDTGSGMTTDVVDRIFDPFFTTKLEGHGLGLGSVLGIVKSHRGAIDVDSRVGSGTCFRIYLPSTAAEEGLEADSAALPIPKASGELVLVAEDEPELRELVQQVLESKGYRTLVTSDGREALDRYIERSSEIDVLLLDIQMPHLSGADVLREVRARDPDVPVVFMSGFDPGEHSRNIEPSGFVHKPFTIDELQRELGMAIQRGRPRASKRARQDAPGVHPSIPA